MVIRLRQTAAQGIEVEIAELLLCVTQRSSEELWRLRLADSPVLRLLKLQNAPKILKKSYLSSLIDIFSK